MENLVWLWIGVIAISIAIEVFTEQLVSIWFVPAAFLTAILSLFKVNYVWQILIFFALSIVGIVLSRVFLAGKKSDADTRTNIEALIGERCVVTERIDNYLECGQVKIKGQIWSAKMKTGTEVIATDTLVTVTAIEGVKLVCEL